ncbi:MAG: hypothetical protein ABR583_09730, partial [Gaiellaceae bacterium]
MVRRLRLGLLLAVLAAVFASPAQATRLDLPYSLSTAHFTIHYDGPPSSSAILVQQAGDLAATLERAHSTFTGSWGFPAPRDDGDGKIDVYVQDLGDLALGLAFRDTGASQTSGYLHISTKAVAMADTAAHELFHLVQYGMWSPAEPWLLEATAEWAGYRFLGFPAAVADVLGDDYPLSLTLGKPDVSLSCSGAACGVDDYENSGYSRWHFFQWATERFSSSFVKDLFDRAATLNDPGLTGTDILVSTLQARGATLA